MVQTGGHRPSAIQRASCQAANWFKDPRTVPRSFLGIARNSDCKYHIIAILSIPRDSEGKHLMDSLDGRAQKPSNARLTELADATLPLLLSLAYFPKTRL